MIIALPSIMSLFLNTKYVFSNLVFYSLFKQITKWANHQIHKSLLFVQIKLVNLFKTMTIILLSRSSTQIRFLEIFKERVINFHIFHGNWNIFNLKFHTNRIMNYHLQQIKQRCS